MYHVKGRDKVRRRGLRLSFLREDRGAINILVALMVPVLLGTMGLVIDGVNVMRVQSQLQDSVDAAAIAVATQISADLETPRSKLEATAHSVLSRNFRSGNGVSDKNLVVKPVVLTDTSAKVIATYKQKHLMMGFFDKHETMLKVEAETMFRGPATYSSRVALVLDNSGSMSRYGRINELRRATIAFANYFRDKPGTRIGLVPFSTYVNIGTHRKRAKWLEVMPEGRRSYTRDVCSSKRDIIGTTNCRMQTYRQTTYPNKKLVDRQHCYVRNGTRQCQTYKTWDYGTPVYTSARRRVCNNIYGPQYQVCRKQRYHTTYTWNGCVSSRVNGESEFSDFRTKKFIGMTNISCSQPITPLTEDVGEIASAAQNMRPRGATYIPQGIEWGRIMLNPEAPLSFKPRASSEAFMVVMSDGINTRAAKDYPMDHSSVKWMYNPNRPPHARAIAIHNQSGSSATVKADATMKSRCDAAKRDGIRIFTIALGVDENSHSYNVLKSCASDEKWHFSFSDTANLTPVFEEIAAQIIEYSQKVRLSN